MKKILSIVLVMAMMLSMVACGDSTEKEITALSGEYGYEDSYFTFSKDGTVTLTGEEETLSGTYVLGDDKSIYFSGEITDSLGMFAYKYEAGADVIVVKMDDYVLAQFANVNGKQIKNAGLNGQYTSDDVSMVLDFSKDGTMIMCDTDAGVSATGTYFLGDDNDIYLSSDFDEFVGMYRFVYQENADAIIFEYEDYVMATFTKASQKIDVSNYSSVNDGQVDEETPKVPTTDEVIEIAKKHATWIEDWFSDNKYASETGWDCYGPIEESEVDYIESYKNGDIEYEDIDIPEGSFVGSCGAAADTSGWPIYRFAYVKTQDGYEIIDLHREDESDAYYDGIEEAAFSACNSILSKILSNTSSVYYWTTYDESCMDYDYSKLGIGYGFYLTNDDGEIFVCPNIGYASYSVWDDDACDYVETVLMLNNEVVNTIEN